MTDPGRCPACYLPLPACMCAVIARSDNALPIVVVRHHLERHKNSNTARLVEHTLSRCVVLGYGAPQSRDSELCAIADATRGIGAAVLFPDASELSPDAPAPGALVVLDGSWSQARRMRRRIPAIAALPAIALPAPDSVPDRLRRSPRPDHMSTAEAVAAALDRFGDSGAAANLWASLAEFVRRSRLPGRHRHRRYSG